MVNRYFNPKPFEGQLYTPPLELIGKAMEISQQRHDKNTLVAHELKNQFIPSLPQDRARANELEAEYNKQVDAVVEKYHGDLSQAGQELNSLIYKLKKDFGPGGEAGAITQNYSVYQNWLKESQDLVEKGKALGQDFNLSHDYHMRNYTGAGKRDPNTGSYNRFNPETLSEYVDPDSIIQDVYKNFKPEKHKIGRTKFVGNQKVYSEDEYEGITPDRLYPSFKNALASNPKFFQYLRQKTKYEGTDPNDVEFMWDNYTKQRAQDLSYMNESSIQKSDYDDAYLIRLRQRLKDDSDKKFLGEMRSMYQYEPTIDISTRNESTITPDNYLGYSENATDRLRPDLPGMGGFTFPLPGTASGSTTNFMDLLEDPNYLQRTNVYKGLAEAVANEQINALASDPAKARQIYQQKYGKDAVWTERFDKQVVAEYKKQEPNHSRMQGIRTPIPDQDVREQMLVGIAAELENPNSVEVVEVGKRGFQRASEVGLSAKDILKDGKLKTNYLAYAQPGGSHAAAGYVIRKDGKEYIIVDQDITRREASRNMERSMGPIMWDNQRKGEPMNLGTKTINGKQVPVYAEPELRFVKNAQGGFDEKYYFHELASDGKGKVTRTDNVYPMSLNEIYELQKPNFEGAFGVGATKKNFMMHSFNQYRNIYDQ